MAKPGASCSFIRSAEFSRGKGEGGKRGRGEEVFPFPLFPLLNLWICLFELERAGDQICLISYPAQFVFQTTKSK